MLGWRRPASDGRRWPSCRYCGKAALDGDGDRELVGNVRRSSSRISGTCDGCAGCWESGGGRGREEPWSPCDSGTDGPEVVGCELEVVGGCGGSSCPLGVDIVVVVRGYSTGILDATNPVKHYLVSRMAKKVSRNPLSARILGD
jgi:hypothetical protein